MYFPRVFGLIVLLLILSSMVMSMDKDERSAIAAIRQGDFPALQSYLEKHPDPNCRFSNGKTGLYYAILYDQARIGRYLIEYGADVNLMDDEGNTPLIYAAERNNFEFCKVLIDRGADPSHKNLKGRRASDFAMQFPGSHTYGYLLFMEEQFRSLATVPSFQDGPYIFYEDDNAVVLTYFERRIQENLTRIIEKTIDYSLQDTILEGAVWDKQVYSVKNSFPSEPSQNYTEGKIFTVGDIHGHYDALLKLLTNNRVIDEQHNWTFGEGRLVLLGDVFDRGEKVTETLWLLYDLQMQARAAGGGVHLLLGNHEIMALTGDHRYLHEKYSYFSQYTQTYYYQLYSANTVMGKWLRSLNVILQINDNLFLHAGISPQLAVMGYSYDEINESVRGYLNKPDQKEQGSREEMILGQFGPLWYRGYGNYGGGAPEVTQEFVDAFMKKKGLKRMIIGHNEQTMITTAFNGKIISADVAIDESGESAQGLLIVGDELYRCYADGSMEALLGN